MRDDAIQTQTQLFDLAHGTVIDAADRRVADYRIATGDSLADESIYAALSIDSVVEIRFDKFSDGRGFTYARRISEAGLAGVLVASGHVIADQADYLRRCGFTHADIPISKIDDWQAALSAIPAHFQHMTNSPRSRMAASTMRRK
ncbi:DUF934 domain-containing protein [Candidatus Puniceispirillum marinum]|uniref:DUF934 domain-containing protein n=1 Tax=Puniceispirillum marinum (strain IMCC1322) TaxID=488538 RepID=D5BMU5_PUNMI|nr:DUF934 domain-containing protein [Candidatus Puniceispirillum marinum]ADE40138.1 hypothetical protein SAR116_1895 [Candidatus Puniceispirillum marinum IMCC1322]